MLSQSGNFIGNSKSECIFWITMSFELGITLTLFMISVHYILLCDPAGPPIWRHAVIRAACNQRIPISPLLTRHVSSTSKWSRLFLLSIIILYTATYWLSGSKKSWRAHHFGQNEGLYGKTASTIFLILKLGLGLGLGLVFHSRNVTQKMAKFEM